MSGHSPRRADGEAKKAETGALILISYETVIFRNLNAEKDAAPRRRTAAAPPAAGLAHAVVGAAEAGGLREQRRDGGSRTLFAKMPGRSDAQMKEYPQSMLQNPQVRSGALQGRCRARREVRRRRGAAMREPAAGQRRVRRRRTGHRSCGMAAAAAPAASPRSSVAGSSRSCLGGRRLTPSPSVQSSAHLSPPRRRRAPPQTLFEKHTADEVRARERAVCLAELKMLRNRLRDCYYSNGVNQMEACKETAQQYADFINSDRFKKADP